MLHPKAVEAAPEFFARLKTLAKSLTDAADMIGRGVGGNAETLRAEGRRLQAWIDNNPPITSPAQILDGAGLPRGITIWWPHGIAFAPAAAEMQDCRITLLSDADADFPPLLVVLAMPSDADFKDLSSSLDLQSDAAQKALGLLAALAKDALTGGRGALRVRAVHGRGGVSDDFDVKWPTWM